MISRIQLILKTKNISPSQFADEIKVQRSGLSHILSGRNNPSLDFILKILKRYPEIDADWLLFGKGEMISQAGKPDTPVRIKETPSVKNSQQPDLFAQTEQELPKPAEKFDKPELPVIPKPEKTIEPVKEEIIKEINKLEKVEKIVIFYDNQTFQEYNPK